MCPRLSRICINGQLLPNRYAYWKDWDSRFAWDAAESYIVTLGRRDPHFKSLSSILMPLVNLRLPISSRWPRELRESGNDILSTKDQEAYIPTASFTSDDDRHFKINLCARPGIVAWTDGHDEAHHTSELQMDLHLDTAKRRAVFALHGHIRLKNTNNKQTNIILFVYPETIQSLQVSRTRLIVPTMQEETDHFIALRFTMSRPPSIVAPKGLPLPLEAKTRDQGILNDVKSLGTVRQFTVFLNSLNLIPEARELLALLPSVFSSGQFGSIETDEDRTCLDTLFHSGPGEEVDPRHIAAPTVPVVSAVPADASFSQTLAKLAEELTAEPAGVIPPPYPKDGTSGKAPGYSASTGTLILHSLSLCLSSLN